MDWKQFVVLVLKMVVPEYLVSVLAISSEGQKDHVVCVLVLWQSSLYDREKELDSLRTCFQTIKGQGHHVVTMSLAIFDYFLI